MKSRNLPNLPNPKQDYVYFQGGLDLETPPIRALPGSLRDAKNFEIDLNGGYSSIKGYERYDGQVSPSDASYAILDVNITGEFSNGDTITGAISGASAEVIAVVDADQDYLAVTKLVGTFQVAENLEVSASAEGTVASVAAIDAALTNLLHAQYKNLSADVYRADISAVPGAGAILGLWMLNDIKYAFRNNAGASAADLYKSTSSGWAQVTLGFELAFTSGGTTEIVEGNVITGATSAATATITRVVLTAGTWAGGDAAGKFIFTSQTGTFESENVDVGASANLATIASDSTAITLNPNGRFEFITENFGGFAGEDRVYGCDGENRGFEFDGTVFVPIDTGMTADTPTHVTAFAKHLFFSFVGSVQHSGIGTPYLWSAILGAAELAVGDTVTNFVIQPGVSGNETLAIIARNRVKILYGTSASDWNLVDYRKEVGAFRNTAQELGMTMFLDDRGVTNLLPTQSYGNFQHNTLSKLVNTWLNARKNTATDSCISRDKNQYRIFFADNAALYVTTYNRKVVGIMPIEFNNKVEVCYSLENSSGAEEIFFGSDNGMVYQMDKGTSFDGVSMDAYLVLHFVHSKTPNIIKKYLSVFFEVQGDGYAAYDFTFELDYTSLLTPQPETETTELELTAATRWDSFFWDSFYWDGKTITPASNKLEGSAENISLILKSDSDYFSPIRFSGAQLQFLFRRIKR